MSLTVVNDGTIYLAGAELGGEASKLMFEPAGETKDCNTFATGGWKYPLATTKGGSVSIEGYIDGDTDDYVESLVSSRGPYAFGWYPARPVAAGGSLWIGQLRVDTNTRTAQVGDTHGRSLAGGLVGSFGLGGQSGAWTGQGPGTVNGSGLNLGAVSASQEIALLIWVLGITGSPTIQVVLQSDGDNTWASPATVTTVNLSARGGSYTTVAGAITDTWFRAQVVLAGVGTTTTLAVAAGILNR